ncbi:uncharacterized protein [Periplaneta americana]|uniref:uncharacterized protein n=1 Tax=Periplaneta americana TaxID=6978 RepID=UPI0037E91B74
MADNNELIRPDWMNTSFFEKALRSAEEDNNITVISSEVKAATAAGDNYGSDMYRAVVQFKRENEIEEKSIIIKAVTMTKVFYHEKAVYAVVLPAMYNLLNEVPSLSNQLFAAKYFYSHLDETAPSIVMEDLKVNGFRLADKKQSGLDLKHCLLVMRTIARFHAASLVLYQKDPTMFEPLMSNVFSRGENKGMEPLFRGYVTRVAREVETWPDYKEKFAHKLHNLRETAQEQWRLGITRNEDGFNVLCHGDLWLNNMMFRYSDNTGDVEDIRFVDFQLTYWTSPAVDLHYFIHTSASAEALDHFELMIQEYYNTLCEILTLLKHPHLQPTMATINEELNKRSLYAVLASVLIRTVVLADRTKIADMGNMIKEVENAHLSEEYNESMKKLLLQFEARGWI